jgi:hypothetical protein
MAEEAEAPAPRLGVDDLESLRSAQLDGGDQDELVRQATECTFVFAAQSGWPSGVIMSFLEHEGTFWLSATAERRHVRALRSDPRVSIVITGNGTALTGRRMISFNGVAITHTDAATKAWFLPRFAARLAPADPDAFVRLLDSPARVVIEVRPVGRRTTHDSRKLPGDGRGSPAR